MNLKIFHYKNILKGDRYLLAFISLLALFSFLPIYSTSTSLVLDNRIELVFYYLFKHAFFLIIGFVILFITQFINYKFLGKISVLLMPIMFILLIATLVQGNNNPNEYNNTNSSRWFNIPIINLSFQTSTAAIVITMIYCARYLSKYRNKKINFIKSFLFLISPILINIGLIFPANGSTSLIFFILSIIVLFIGGYPIKYLIIFILIVISLSSFFIISAIKLNNIMPNNRVHTWKNRIINFIKKKNESYQIKRSKTAIILGGSFGRGPGKSALKIFLPQSSSDFIYSIIIEEYGLLGGIILLFIYILILFRILIIITKIDECFANLVVVSIGFLIVIQALINTGVTVGLFPITGQTLPLVSSGGTSMWINSFGLGIILNISRISNKKINFN